jgi:hypothetical protein
MKNFISYLSKIFLFSILISFTIQPIYSACRKAELWTWKCPEGSREKIGWRVMEDTDGDGKFDTETVKCCNGALDRHPIINHGNNIHVGTTPIVDYPSFPTFSLPDINVNNWIVIQKDSSSNMDIYWVVHTVSPDTTYIQVMSSKATSAEISFLQGEYPQILEKSVIIPNPANNSFKLLFNNDISYFVNVIISDINGKIYYKKKLRVEQNANNSLKLDTRNWSNGIYIINLKSEGLSTTKNLIIKK